MPKTTVYRIKVQFGDCDPAGIVFFPNYSRWMDAASLHFFEACGVPPWRELSASSGIIGTPLLEIHTKFMKSATYGETLTIHTHVEAWRHKVFVQKHVVMRDGQVLCEGLETRAFCIRTPEDPGRIKAIPVPAEILAQCMAA